MGRVILLILGLVALNTPAVAGGPPVLDTTGLVLHLETDAGLVTTGSTLNFWDDLSPQGNHLIASGGPTVLPAALGGRDVVRFDGVDDKCERLATFGITGLPTGNANRSVFLVARYQASGPGGFTYGKIACNQAFGLIVVPPAGNLMLSGLCGPNDFLSLASGNGAGWIIQSAVLDGGQITHYGNGEPLTSTQHTFNTIIDRITLGAEIDSSPFVAMDVAAVLVYDRALTSGEHEGVLTYLADAYFGSEAPSAHDDLMRCPRGGSLVIDVLANDFPTTGIDPTTVEISSPPQHGLVDVDPVTGEVLYTHDALHQQADSFTYTVAAPGTAPSTPATVRLAFDDPGCPLITGDLILHLDAGTGLVEAAGSVTAWRDHSGHGNDLTAGGTPVRASDAVNGHDAVAFDGVSDKLERTQFLNDFPFGSQDRTLFAVVEYQGLGPGGIAYGNTQCNQAFGLFVDGTGNLLLSGWCPASDFPSTAPGTGAGWLVQRGVVAAGVVTHAVDDMVLSSVPFLFNTQPQRVVLGALLNSSPYVDMNIAELLLYGRALSAGEQDQVLSYLRGKYFDEFCTPPCLPPVVESDPASDSLCVGGMLTLSVQASGTSPGYQWRKDGLALGGETADTFTIPAVTPSDGGDYDVVVTNACGTATSAVASITVEQPPTISQQPMARSGCPGDTLTLTVAAAGTPPFTYQWRQDGLSLPGAHDATLTLANLDLDDAGSFDCVVTNGCGQDTSQLALVMVEQPPQVLLGPDPHSVCEGSPVTFSVAVTGLEPITYQWLRDGSPIPGATGDSYTIASTVPADAGQYSVELTNPCTTIESPTAQLVVFEGPTIVQGPAPTAACLGDTVSLSVVATGTAPLTYQWLRNGTEIAGATASELELMMVDASANGDYAVEVSNGCGSVLSLAATVLVQSVPQILAQPRSLTTCEGFTATLTVTAADPSTVSYQWRRNGLNLLGATDSSLVIASTTPGDAGSYDVVVMNGCSFVTSSSVTLAVTAQALCDCNANGLLDGDEIAQGSTPDCNQNGVPDSCDIASGSSVDLDMNGIPDDCGLFVRGDCNADGGNNIADAIFLLSVLFPAGTPPTPSCRDACDCNDDGGTNIADAICILESLFGMPPTIPAAPHPDCGPDPTTDALDCAADTCP